MHSLIRRIATHGWDLRVLAVFPKVSDFVVDIFTTPGCLPDSGDQRLIFSSQFFHTAFYSYRNFMTPGCKDPRCSDSGVPRGAGLKTEIIEIQTFFPVNTAYHDEYKTIEREYILWDL